MATLSLTTRPLPLRSLLRPAAFPVLALPLLVSFGVVTARTFGKPPPPSASVATLPPPAIVARGRIEAASRMRVVGGLSTSGTVAELRVAEGQRLTKGDVIAVLDQHAVRTAGLQGARAGLMLAERDLDHFEAGGKEKEIEAFAAQASIAAMDLAQAERLAERGRSLSESQVMSRQQLEELELNLARKRQEVAKANAEWATAKLNFAIDRQLAALHVEQARADVDRAAAELELTIVRAPIDGSVLTITARPGSAVGLEGIVTMADLSALVVVAEVATGDAPRLRPGDAVAVEPSGTGERLSGRVRTIQNRVFSSEPASSDVLTGPDARVVEAEIVLDSPERLPAFINAEVTVSIRSATS